MEQIDLLPIFIIEMISTIFGFGLLIIEIRTLHPSFKSGNRRIILSLLGILVFTNFIHLIRAAGIYADNPSIRQIGAILSALLATSSLVIWGSYATKLNNKKRLVGLGGILLGTALYIVGVSINNLIVIILGVGFFSIIAIITVIFLFRFVFSETTYTFAKKRIFLMTLSISFIAIFEGLSVGMLNAENYVMATIFFGFEIPARILMTLSINLNEKIQGLLSFIH